MSPRTPLILLCALASLTLGAQGKYATVIEDTEVFTMQSLSDGTLTVRRTVEVYSEQGLDAALFLVYTDKNETLASFSGELQTKGGEKKSIKKKDLLTVSVAEGIASDGFMTGYRPSPKSFPFTVSYSYTVLGILLDFRVVDRRENRRESCIDGDNALREEGDCGENVCCCGHCLFSVFVD